MSFEVLPRDYFVGDVPDVARRLLGQRLVRRLGGEVLAGRIVEVEAYGGPEDSTSHAARGSNGRARGMFGEVGRAYVYLIYGMHACLNVVAHAEGGVGAVLIRALAPEAGVESMRRLRGGVPDRLIASGPGRLCQALAVDRSLDRVDLCDASAPLLLAGAPPVEPARVQAGLRVGVVGQPAHIALPWRYFIADEPNVSGGRSARRSV